MSASGEWEYTATHDTVRSTPPHCVVRACMYVLLACPHVCEPMTKSWVA